MSLRNSEILWRLLETMNDQNEYEAVYMVQATIEVFEKEGDKEAAKYLGEFAARRLDKWEEVTE